MNEDTKCAHCEVLTQQRDSVQKDVDYLTGLLERARIDRNKALVRVTELVTELNEFRTADDNYNAHARHYAKKCAELRKELEQCKTPESLEIEAERERALIADRLGVPPCDFLTPHVLKALDELECERDRANDLLKDKQFAEAECTRLSAELAALRERTSVPMKVRWDVSADNAWAAWDKFASETTDDTPQAQFYMDYFAAHAGIDVSAGVPSVPELAKILRSVFIKGEEALTEPYGSSEKLWIQAATILRDAVLAGVTGEQSIKDAILESHKQRTSADHKAFQEELLVSPLDDGQVEALARVLHKARGDSEEWDGKFGQYQANMMNAASAAIAHLSTRPEGLPTAEKLWGLIGSIEEVQYDGKGIEYIELEQGDMSNLLTALRPWLRDPADWELDVTAEEWADKCREFWTISVKTKDAFDLELKDFIKSRIRPIYECKECANKQARIHRLEGWAGTLEGYCDDMRKLAAKLPARAALEGE